MVEYLKANAPGSPLPDGLAELVYRHSEGNPLFMVASLDHMIERSLVSRENGSWQPRVPLTQMAHPGRCQTLFMRQLLSKTHRWRR